MRFRTCSTIYIAAYCAVMLTSSVYGASLPDTGQDTCYDGTNMVVCTADNAGDAATYPGQDGRFGRDAAADMGQLPKTGDGAAGFDYTRVCHNGELAGQGICPENPLLGSNPDDWACTQDNTTGLTWEVKTNDDIATLRDMDWTYSWYDTDSTSNGGNAGQPDDGINGNDNCFDSTRCDTQKYIEDINSFTLCGHDDWRLPNFRELNTLLHLGKLDSAIDDTHFPNTVLTGTPYYWTTSTTYGSPENVFRHIWVVNFINARLEYIGKWTPHFVRLVRGERF